VSGHLPIRLTWVLNQGASREGDHDIPERESHQYQRKELRLGYAEDKIDSAIRTLSENRAEIGSLQNRLQSTISNLQIYDENLSAARSRIYDVDMASETAELTKNNILSTAGTAVLSQANQNNMLALKLIS
jgi:flagellin-like hook-associated protein FlgL